MKSFLIIFLVVSTTQVKLSAAAEFCVVYCDGVGHADIDLNDTRIADSGVIHSRTVTLVISDRHNLAYATIEGGAGGDEVWLDRSFNGGYDWTNGSKLGDISVLPGQSQTRTGLYNIDNPAVHGIGALRACGKPGDIDELICTEWARSTVLADTPINAAATSLMAYFNGVLWDTIGWWNSANALTALIDYLRLQPEADRNDFLYVVDTVFVNNLDAWDGNYTSDALDDTEWWALVWLDAYDLTGDRKYLDMAIFDADYIYQYRDGVCGGGIWWSIDKTYKNAITNELYIQLAAALHNRLPGDLKYLNQAIELWVWFKGSGMIDEEVDLIHDGLRDDCKSNRDTTWTYNQGVILGGLVELYKATGNNSYYLLEARKIADAVVQRLSPNGVLQEPCEEWLDVGCGGLVGCDCNQISFKGIFMRHLGELNRHLATGPYTDYIQAQIDSNYEHNRNLLNQYGIHYAGPFINHNAGTQQSGLEAFIAALPGK